MQIRWVPESETEGIPGTSVRISGLMKPRGAGAEESYPGCVEGVESDVPLRTAGRQQLILFGSDRIKKFGTDPVTFRPLSCLMQFGQSGGVLESRTGNMISLTSRAIVSMAKRSSSTVISRAPSVGRAGIYVLSAFC
jgi:hypothetical protein